MCSMMVITVTSISLTISIYDYYHCSSSFFPFYFMFDHIVMMVTKMVF